MIGRKTYWASSFALAYTYVGFPLVVLVRAAVRPRSLDLREASTPTVSVVIAAHNEAAAIADKVANVLALEYPAESLDCIVVSDGSTDDTVAAASGIGSDRVTVLDLPRAGKATALNRGIEVASGDVLVFTDANSVLAPDAISKLVEPLRDPEVGGVAGDQRYLGADGSAAGERAYWSFDRLLKRAESQGGNVISATGALYAVRRELARPVPDGVTDDFTMSTGVIELGHRLVFAADAAAYEPAASGLSGEYQRKVRVMTRGLRAVILRRRLLDPRRSGFYAVQLLSHKVLRRLSVVPLLLSTVSALRLRRRGRFYRLAGTGQAAVVGGAIVSLALGRTGLRERKVLAVSAYFGMVNVAALHALWNVLTGKQIDRWTPQRSDDR